MEILKTEKPDNEIEYIEELNIPRVEKEPLSIENVDYLSIEVDQRLRSRMKSKNYIVEGVDSIELQSLDKSINNEIEYIEEL